MLKFKWSFFKDMNSLVYPFFSFLNWNMEYHLEHHMFPAVPSYNLKKLSIKINNQTKKINPQEKKILEKSLLLVKIF